MTKEEAIQDLKMSLRMWGRKPQKESYEMAIEALERETEVEEKTAWVRDALDKGWFDDTKSISEELNFVQPHKKVSVNLDLKSCEDAVSRQAVIDEIRFGQSYITRISPDGELTDLFTAENEALEKAVKRVEALPSTEKTGHCKDCKYFEYDSVAKVDGIPLIVAHEICNKWGDGCKTKEDGYCFLFEGGTESDT